MANFLINWFLTFLFLEFIFYFTLILDQLNFLNYINNFYLIVLFFFSINFIFLIKKEKFNNNSDLIAKYYLLLMKTPNLFLNFFFNVSKQISLFFIFFKLEHFFKCLKIIFNVIASFITIRWRPLFKKFSYFGYFRSHRSKWIK